MSKPPQRDEHGLQIRVATLFTDAGARGNPGPAAMAYRVLDADGNLLEANAELVGTRTCNEAEYDALIAGLRACARLGVVALHVVSDSELMVRQLNGEYRVKSSALVRRFEHVCELLREEFAHSRVEHRRRDDRELSACDRMVNGVLDAAGFPKKPPHFQRRSGAGSQSKTGD
jgi:ribonuclease HI